MTDVKRIIESGIKPLELYYQSVLDTQFSTVCAYRSELRINDLELGVLMAEQYMPVALRTSRCVFLSKWNLDKICIEMSGLMKKSIDFDWFSLYIPTRMLLKSDLPTAVYEALGNAGIEEASSLCLEFSEEIFYEDSDKINEIFEKLKAIGVKTMLSGFGSDYCPNLRLSQIPFDMVLLDEGVTRRILKRKEDKGLIEAVVYFAKQNGCYIVANGVENADELNDAYKSDCMAAVGKIADKRHNIAELLEEKNGESDG